MRTDAFVSAIGCILFSLVAVQVTAAPQDEEENEDFIVHVFPPLKLGLPICAFKADSGPCKAINNRYHFNIHTRQCEMFNYGGCEGNANNFQTLEECQEKCIVPEFPEMIKRTKFKTDIERPSYCLLESQPGICRGLFSRYFYNKETQLCETFFYSGCLGNQNNFRSLKECQDTCQGSFPLGNSWQTENDSLPFGETNSSTPVAKRVPSGNSWQTENDSLPFGETNSSAPVAKPVIWANSLQMEDSVRLSIKNTSSPVVKQESSLLPSLCVMPMDKGLCRASEKRFFYNYNTGKCYPFSYTGCGGNENNFTTRKACVKMCKKGFIIKQGQKGIMKIRRKRKKQPVKETNQRIVIEAI